jgi:hypothetical protein
MFGGHIMHMQIKILLAAVLAATFAGDALAQSQGPLTTVPWAARSRLKPNPEGQQQDTQQPATSGGLQIYSPLPTKPVEGAPAAAEPKAADR